MKFPSSLVAALLVMPACVFADEPTGAAAAALVEPAPALADTWDLTVLFADGASWEKARQALVADIPSLAAYKGRLAEGPGMLLEVLEKQSALNLRYIHLALYANLQSDEDTRVAEGQELGSDLAQAASWLNPEILAMGDTAVRAAIAAEPRLAPYRFGLENTLRQRPHTLGAEAEGVLAAVSPLTGAAGNIYSILSNADIPWPSVTLSDGTVARLDASGYTRFRGVADRDDRKKVFDAFWGTFQTYARTFGTTLYSQNLADVISALRSRLTMCRARFILRSSPR
jgi:oligoendopeptidase F